MQQSSLLPIFVSEEHGFGHLDAPKHRIIPFHEFEPNGQAAVFVMDSLAQMREAEQKMRRMSKAALAQSVLLFCLKPDEPTQDNLPKNALLLRCVTEHARREAAKFLLGAEDARPPIELFFPPQAQALDNPRLYDLALALETCERFRIPGFTRDTLCEWLAEKCGSERANCLKTLTTNFQKLYGASPGRFLRVWRILVVTEQSVEAEGNGRGQRIIKEFRRTFQTVFDKNFDCFADEAREKHWLAGLFEIWNQGN